MAFGYVKACAEGAWPATSGCWPTSRRPSVMARYLDQIGVRYRAMPAYADTTRTSRVPLPGGRTMDPLDFNARKLGHQALEDLRPTCPGQLIFGRMQMNAFEAQTILARERKAKLVLAWIMLRYFLDYPWRRKTPRDAA